MPLTPRGKIRQQVQPVTAKHRSSRAYRHVRSMPATRRSVVPEEAHDTSTPGDGRMPRRVARNPFLASLSCSQCGRVFFKSCREDSQRASMQFSRPRFRRLMPASPRRSDPAGNPGERRRDPTLRCVRIEILTGSGPFRETLLGDRVALLAPAREIGCWPVLQLIDHPAAIDRQRVAAQRNPSPRVSR